MKEISEVIDVPVIPLRDIVVYPNMAVPLFIGRKCSIAAVEHASQRDQRVLLITQKNEQTQSPRVTDLYKVGVYAKILQVMKLPDNTIKVLVEGISRADIYYLQRKKDLMTATPIFSEMVDVQDQKQGLALTKAIKDNFKHLLDVNAQVPKDVSATILAEKRLDRLVDTVASLVNAPIASKQKVLELVDLKDRALFLLQLLVEELEIYELEQKIKDTVKNQIEKNQREYYLNEQIKAIYKELGDVDEATENEQLRGLITKAKMSKEATEKALAELRKLKMMPSSSAEASVCRNYIETLIKLPWCKKDKVNKDIVKAEAVLDSDHYGLEKVKERIVEHLAVLTRQKKSKGTILCLVGPPGVGKTSLGRSIADATGRSYVRMALGGVKDESEIRGHRRTYIGSMPGQIINKITKAGVNNPLFLLDEIDKISSDYRGDPAAALLEVLDPEQNNTFNDHYLEVDFDLSDVMFVATANSLNIPIALRDRMEIIHLSGYTEDEKYHIAQKYLVPKAMLQSGLDDKELSISENALRDIVRYYTREAGVRRLQQEINRICRKAVKMLLTNARKKTVKVDHKNLDEFLGVRKFDIGIKQAVSKVGQVTGLAWTEVGGELLTIETAVMAGKGKLKYTGTLGDVMKESIEAAMTVVRMRASDFGLSADFYEKHDIHIHVPEGATPKDGPSAGIAMCTAMISSLTGIKVDNHVAMTGEITLRGDVLAIGGLKEKLLAAVRGGITTALIPWDNKKDLEELPKNLLASINIVPVKTIDEVFTHALVKKKA